jgi:putative tricarboxylic transport membrane protein
MHYYGYPGSPILLAIILGPMVEQNMRRSLVISHGDPTIFLTRPISAAFILVGILMMVMSYYRVRKAMDREGAPASRIGGEGSR